MAWYFNGLAEDKVKSNSYKLNVIRRDWIYNLALIMVKGIRTKTYGEKKHTKYLLVTIFSAPTLWRVLPEVLSLQRTESEGGGLADKDFSF